MRPLPLPLSSLVLLALLILSNAPYSLAQSDPSHLSTANDTGVKPDQTYAGARENVNLSNGNLNIIIPLVTLPGRGGHDLVLSTSYDTKGWILERYVDTWNGVEYFLWVREGGDWRIHTQARRHSGGKGQHPLPRGLDPHPAGWKQAHLPHRSR
jgi:hypothetical protein